jgi:para-nitrobenzyl esterase
MVMRLVLALLVVAAYPAGNSAPASAETTGDPLVVEGGRIAGEWRANSAVRAYLGLPFAAPPVGALRWRPPQPVVPWQGVKQAGTLPPQCMQKIRSRTSVYHEYSGDQPRSEDCLYLNVWAPADAIGADLPVMVWIYGGGFQFGSSANPVYDGTALAQRAVVLVTLNYRVGIFGFLAHPELSSESPQHVSGNYGLLDQIAALQWVRRNIRAFGGNPDNVTIFGQSAGANSVDALMVAPAARGLFRQAIAESFGFLAHMDGLADAEKQGVAVTASLGASGIAALRAMPAEQLLGANTAFWPIVDGTVLPDDIRAQFQAGREAPVPLLTGWVADEGSAFPHATTRAGFERDVRKGFGEAADRVLAAYPARDDAEANEASKALFGDKTMVWGAWTAARLHAGHGFPTYVYTYKHAQPMFPGQTYDEIDSPAGLGTFHSSEYPYIFGTLPALHRAWTSLDRILSEQLRSYWVAYAVAGNPNVAGLPTWPGFRATAETVMRLGDQTGPGTVPHLDRLELLDAFTQAPTSN